MVELLAFAYTICLHRAVRGLGFSDGLDDTLLKYENIKIIHEGVEESLVFRELSGMSTSLQR